MKNLLSIHNSIVKSSRRRDEATDTWEISLNICKCCVNCKSIKLIEKNYIFWKTIFECENNLCGKINLKFESCLLLSENGKFFILFFWEDWKNKNNKFHVSSSLRFEVHFISCLKPVSRLKKFFLPIQKSFASLMLRLKSLTHLIKDV